MKDHMDYLALLLLIIFIIYLWLNGSSSGSAPLCPPGETECQTFKGNYCADLTSDWQNCNACGNVCNLGPCEFGDCTASCFGDYNLYCGPITGCVDANSDPNNCGQCGNEDGGICAEEQVCDNGQCITPS